MRYRVIVYTPLGIITGAWQTPSTEGELVHTLSAFRQIASLPCLMVTEPDGGAAFVPGALLQQSFVRVTIDEDGTASDAPEGRNV